MAVNINSKKRDTAKRQFSIFLKRNYFLPGLGNPYVLVGYPIDLRTVLLKEQCHKIFDFENIRKKFEIAPMICKVGGPGEVDL